MTQIGVHQQIVQDFDQIREELNVDGVSKPKTNDVSFNTIQIDDQTRNLLRKTFQCTAQKPRVRSRFQYPEEYRKH